MGEWFIPSVLKTENRSNMIHQFESDFLLYGSAQLTEVHRLENGYVGEIPAYELDSRHFRKLENKVARVLQPPAKRVDH
jgi:hypothetical protein